MSELNITEYANLGRDASGYTVPVGEEIASAIHNISFTTSSVQSASFQPNTRFVRVVADIDTRIIFGLSPTADQLSSSTLPAGAVEYFGVKQGKDHKVAAIQLI